tara:strand:+ start:120 stop:350 length:231 start_codon:yes stop_codon:yes gene_type:complete
MSREDEKAFACASSNGYQSGMNLRDYFAAKAMQAIISGKLPNGGSDFVIGATGQSNGVVCRASYAIADEMLKAREQ